MFKTDVACDLFVKLKVMLIKERLNNMLCTNIVASLLSSKNILILHFFFNFYGFLVSVVPEYTIR